MTSEMHMSCFFTGFCFLTIYALQVAGSGHLRIRLKSYEDITGKDMDGDCCDGLAAGTTTNVCKPCDHFIFACLLDNRDHGNGPCISNNITTYPVTDSNTITFGSNIGHETNPFSLNFTVPTKNLILTFSIYDDDKHDVPPIDKPQLLENTSYVVYTLLPLPFTANATFTNGTIPTNQSRLLFDYSLQCDENFYGLCDRYCLPDPIKYTCKSDGTKICKPGWEDKNCSTYNYCYNQTCLNGGTCRRGLTDFSCDCEANHAGTNCQIFITPDNQTVTKSTKLISTTSTSGIQSSHTSQPSKLQGETPSKNKGPLIAGVTIGVIAGLALLAGGIAYFVMRHKNKIHSDSNTGKDDIMQEDNNADSKVKKSDDNETAKQAEDEKVNNINETSMNNMNNNDVETN